MDNLQFKFDTEWWNGRQRSWGAWWVVAKDKALKLGQIHSTEREDDVWIQKWRSGPDGFTGWDPMHFSTREEAAKELLKQAFVADL